MGGTKRKIEIEEIKEKSVKSVTFTKRRNGLFRKASELCLLSPTTQIAILATPVFSSNSHASFYTFGHSSVDQVVSSLLHNHSTPPLTNQDNGLRFWWENEDFDRSDNVDELKDASDAITRMLNNVRTRLDSMRSTNQEDKCLVIYQEEENVETKQNPKLEKGSGSKSLVAYQEEEENLQLTNVQTNQVPPVLKEGSASAISLVTYQEENRVPKFKDGSRSGSLLKMEDDIDLHFDDFDFYADFNNIVPF